MGLHSTLLPSTEQQMSLSVVRNSFRSHKLPEGYARYEEINACMGMFLCIASVIVALF
jgi:predicted ribonuclease toxin of YeeF-YezG toxin-antitoxin module